MKVWTFAKRKVGIGIVYLAVQHQLKLLQKNTTYASIQEEDIM